MSNFACIRGIHICNDSYADLRQLASHTNVKYLGAETKAILSIYFILLSALGSVLGCPEDLLSLYRTKTVFPNCELVICLEMNWRG